jgi:hypothetical protein
MLHECCVGKAYDCTRDNSEEGEASRIVGVCDSGAHSRDNGGANDLNGGEGRG